jgi:hypothetical protein
MGGNASLVAVVQPGSTTTYKISSANTFDTSGTVKAAMPENGAGNNATRLVAVKLG